MCTLEATLVRPVMGMRNQVCGIGGKVILAAKFQRTWLDCACTPRTLQKGVFYCVVSKVFHFPMSH